MMDLSQAKGNWEAIRKALPAIFEEYETDINNVECRLVIKGKTAAAALHEQAGWVSYYGQKKAEISKLLKYMDSRVESCRGKLHRKFMDNSSRALSDRERDKLINNDDEFLSTYELYLEVEELHAKFAAICDAFTTRGYTMKNLTELKVASLNNEIF